MNAFIARLHLLLRGRERGQTMAEYAVVLGVITIALMAAFTFLGGAISTAIGSVTTKI